MDIPYASGFPADELQRWLETAESIPQDPYGWEDKQYIPRAEAAVRQLEILVGKLELTLQKGDTLTNSALAKRCHAIASAAKELLKKLGAEETSGGKPVTPDQVYRALRSRADAHGEMSAGFPHHPPSSITAAGDVEADFHGDLQLSDDVEAVRRIRDWALEAEERARKLFRTRKGPPHGKEIAHQAHVTGGEIWTDDPTVDAFRGLVQIWTEILGQEVRTTIDADGMAYGPVLDFIQIGFAILKVPERPGGKPLGSDAIRSRIRQMA